mgnify:CR=1 FL=1
MCSSDLGNLHYLFGSATAVGARRLHDVWPAPVETNSQHLTTPMSLPRRRRGLPIGALQGLDHSPVECRVVPRLPRCRESCGSRSPYWPRWLDLVLRAAAEQVADPVGAEVHRRAGLQQDVVCVLPVAGAIAVAFRRQEPGFRRKVRRRRRQKDRASEQRGAKQVERRHVACGTLDERQGDPRDRVQQHRDQIGDMPRRSPWR